MKMTPSLYLKGIRNAIYFEPETIDNNENFKFMNTKIVEGLIPDRYLVSNYGRIYDTYNEKFISLNFDRKGLKKDGTPKGYQYCKISYQNGNHIDYKRVRVNRVVATTFNYREDFKNLEVNHINGNHSDNNIKNLEWNTSIENKEHAVKNKLFVNGEQSYRALITNKQAEAICQMMEQGKSNKEISQITNLKPDLISDIRTGHSYRYISCNYNIPQKAISDISDEEVIKVANMLINGKNYNFISDSLGISKSRISEIKNKTYKPELLKDYNFSICINPDKLKLIHNICKDLENGISPTDIQSKYECPKHLINCILSGHGYRYISKDYNFSKFKNILNDETVELICKDLVENTKTFSQIAQKFNLKTNIVQDIYYKKTYKHISTLYTFPQHIIMRGNDLELSEKTVKKICELLEQGKSPVKISKYLEVPASKIYHIKYRDTHINISKNYKW